MTLKGMVVTTGETLLAGCVLWDPAHRDAERRRRSPKSLVTGLGCLAVRSNVRVCGRRSGHNRRPRERPSRANLGRE